jgi:hypothetical protein
LNSLPRAGAHSQHCRCQLSLVSLTRLVVCAGNGRRWSRHPSVTGAETGQPPCDSSRHRHRAAVQRHVGNTGLRHASRRWDLMRGPGRAGTRSGAPGRPRSSGGLQHALLEPGPCPPQLPLASPVPDGRRSTMRSTIQSLPALTSQGTSPPKRLPSERSGPLRPQPGGRHGMAVSPARPVPGMLPSGRCRCMPDAATAARTIKVRQPIGTAVCGAELTLAASVPAACRDSLRAHPPRG